MLNNESDSRKILTALNQLLFFERRNILEFEGVTIYPSEIHLILVVGKDSTSNATRMAETLGITKGAVSQTIARLEKKGIVKKEKDPYNKNEMTVSLLPLGLKAFDKYKQLQEAISQELGGLLSTFSRSERKAIMSFFERFSDVLKKLK